MSTGFEVVVLAMPTGAWTPITVPITCSTIVVENTALTVDCAFRVRSDDSTSQKTIPGGMELSVRATAPCFEPGDVVGYLNPASGSGPACVSFTR